MPVGKIYHSFERQWKFDFLDQESKWVIALDVEEHNYASDPMASHF